MRVFQDCVQQTAAVNTHSHTQQHTQPYRGNHINTHNFSTGEHTPSAAYTHLCGVWGLRRACEHIPAYMYSHTHCKWVCAGTHTPILEYDMSMCNYMANAEMIWCLNISTDLCCAGIVAIHSQGQAWRQQHETHECECVHPTRELAVQLGIFMTGLIAQGPREDRPEKRYRKHVVNHEGKEMDGWGGRAFASDSENQKGFHRNLSRSDFLLSWGMKRQKKLAADTCQSRWEDENWEKVVTAIAAKVYGFLHFLKRSNRQWKFLSFFFSVTFFLTSQIKHLNQASLYSHQPTKHDGHNQSFSEWRGISHYVCTVFGEGGQGAGRGSLTTAYVTIADACNHSNSVPVTINSLNITGGAFYVTKDASQRQKNWGCHFLVHLSHPVDTLIYYLCW